MQKHKNTTTCNCLNGWNRKGIDYRDGSCLEEVQELGMQSGAITRATPSPSRKSWAASIQMCSRRHGSAYRYRHPVWNKLQAGAFNSQPLTPLMKLGFIGCVRSTPPPPPPPPSHSCIKSAERCTLNIWHGESESITSEQMPLLLLRKSALCGNDLCHVPLIMVMIALEGVSGDVIQRAAECEWQGHPKWQ